MRNADWITVENRSEAWYKFKDWCRSKYGNSFADAYTAFMWMIDPEYCIMTEDNKEIDIGNEAVKKLMKFSKQNKAEMEAEKALNKIIEVCSGNLNAGSYLNETSLFEFCKNVMAEASTYLNRPYVECFDAVLEIVHDEKNDESFNPNTRKGRAVLLVEEIANKGRPNFDVSSEDRELNPGIASIQKQCMEKMTPEVFTTNINLYRFASKILDTIAHFDGRLSQGEIFKTIADIAADVIMDEVHYGNSQLIALARDVKDIAYNWKNGPSR